MINDNSKIPEEYMSAKMWVLAPHRINSLEWDERLGNQLKTIRESQGLTQPGLAERAGISRNLIEHLERGKYLESSPRRGASISVSMETLVKIATALDINPHMLYMCHTQGF
jgi:ribosome-binding protein aMBF1 (putative translation factor)